MPSTFEVLLDSFGKSRVVAVARELTKMHESIEVGTISTVFSKFQESSKKGEFTLVVAPDHFEL